MRLLSLVRGALLSGCAVAAFAAAPAFAQTPDATATPAADAPDPDGGVIIVTALKRETDLQKTPIAMSVVGAIAMKDRHVESLYDLADGSVPSLRVATFEARQSALTVGIRGIVPLDANQPAREQGVGIYIDGIYLGRQHGLNAGLFDLERVEVLKGPQGTLFGRNTEGGALSLVAKAPTGEFDGRVGGGIGNYGAYNGDAHIDLPEFHNISVKLDGIVQYQGATTKNPLAGQTGWNYYDRRGLRAAARWKPTSDITDDFSYDTGYDANSPFYSQLLNYNPNNCPSGSATTPVASVPAACTLPGTAFTGVTGTIKPIMPGVIVNGTSRMKTADIGVPQQPSIDKTHGFTNSFKWKVSPELEIRSLTAWRGVTATQWDNSGGEHRVPVVAPGCTGSACNFSRYSLADLRQAQFSQEFQAVGSVGSIDYVAGLFYFNEHVSDDAATPNSTAIQGYTTAGQTSGYSFVTLDPCTGSAGFGSQLGCRSQDRSSEVWSKSYAAYGQVTWNATDALHLTVGGRYTHDKKSGVLHFSRNINYDTNPAAAALNGYAPLDKSWDRFNPMATVAYDISNAVHAYAKYSTGYRAGGASSRTANYQAFNPEDVKSYEVGLKSDFWGHKGRLNVAAYMMDREGSQVDLSTIQSTATGNFNNLVTFNAPGTTKIRGIEAELMLKPAKGLTLNASYAYTYTDIPAVPVTYKEYTSAGVATGNATTVNQKFYIVFTPRNAASGSVDYDLPVGSAWLRFHLDANYSQSTQSFDQFATHNDSSLIFNSRVSLADISLGDAGRKMTVGMWVRNLFDYAYVYRRDPSNSLPAVQATNVFVGSVGNVLGDYGNFNTPRTWGVDVNLSF